MPIKHIINGIKKVNNVETLKANLDMKKHIDTLQKMGWKKFWQMNNKLFKLLGILIVGTILFLKFAESKFVENIENIPRYSEYYFWGTLLLYSGLIVYVIHFMMTESIKDFNVNTFTRIKMKEFSGVDWKKADGQFKNKNN